ncbi:TetR/AcrR family transcriptional regulator [Salinibacterium sp. dk2585]|uniref:TetR/AcrR family transcriptional regulator n=1 Tax=unclassified Salinibacterium TaxID=2632331 RepID=UPI0011C24672|nr:MULTISPECIES: TetR/AcrR family transcriptional regulator [unclassified Salinibacterium]QEE61415.1 TetR/AcrR family transcriptional regulator [Salinibacterium sp. dk2585]TXK54092.1 TetR/AcrR family transcriptional regulator [Salinibacterium sp. dk5596]
MPNSDLDALHATTAALRNEPVQARSAARLTRLLDSAAEVIDEIGYERLTTAMVAERAGASIGTVYRYFPDRIAVLQSLSVRFLNDFIEEVSSALQAESVTSWQEAVDAVIDTAVRSFATKPGFRSLRFGDVIDVRPREEDRTHNAVVASVLAEVFANRFDVTGDDLSLRVEVAVQLVDSLLARAFAFDPAGDERIIAEGRALVHSYLASAFTS